MTNTTKRYITIIAILALVTGGLFFIDMQNQSADDSPGFFTNIIRDWFRPNNISTDILKKTSLSEHSISTLRRSKDFFPPYLSLPEKITAVTHEIKDTSITIFEVPSQNPYKIVKYLTEQSSQEYRFNKINQGTFYLNQVPADSKTHNFLAIIIENTLYGFQYKPIDHRKVLEIIDVLEKNQ